MQLKVLYIKQNNVKVFKHFDRDAFLKCCSIHRKWICTLANIHIESKRCSKCAQKNRWKSDTEKVIQLKKKVVNHSQRWSSAWKNWIWRVFIRNYPVLVFVRPFPSSFNHNCFHYVVFLFTLVFIWVTILDLEIMWWLCDWRVMWNYLYTSPLLNCLVFVDSLIYSCLYVNGVGVVLILTFFTV